MPIKKGNTTIGAIYKGTTQIAKVYKGTKLLFENAVWLDYYFNNLYHDLIPTKLNKNELLPQQYQEVEYIESSGTQYIDTTLTIPSGYSNYLTEIKFAYTGTVSGETYNSVYGINSSLQLARYPNGNFTDGTNTTTFNITNNQIYVYKGDYSNGKSYLDNVAVATRSINVSNNAYLFSSGANLYPSICKLYYCKIYDNGTLVRNFVPCYRKSDSVIGLYDTVGGVFYTNSGSGTFTKGNDVYRTVKNKLKLATIYGNSVVENQLNSYIGVQTQTSNGITKTNNNDGSFTLSGLASADTVLSVGLSFSRVSGHYYLLTGCPSGGSNSTYRLLEGYSYYWVDTGNSSLRQATSSGTSGLVVDIKSGTDFGSGKKFFPQFIDLTQEFPFDTPTTLTDNRVQAILNRGYIPYNTGKVKSVDIGEFSSEPYNLFDEIWEVGGFGSNGSLTTNTTNCRSVNYIKVLGGVSYSFERGTLTTSNTSGRYIEEYDENFNWLGEQSLGNLSVDVRTATTQINTRYIKLCYYIASYNFTNNLPIDTTFHRTGTRTGYAPHTQPQTISFKYQGSGVGTSHDTMEIGKENVVFTKNMSKYTFTGNEGWAYGSSQQYFGLNISSLLGAKLPTDSSSLGNDLCNVLQQYSTSEAQNDTTKDMCFFITQGGYIGIRNTTYNDLTNFSSWINGKQFEYELATPQVITIPRKHLGVVDLGSLSWTYDSTNHIFYYILSDMVNGVWNTLPNIYCSMYLTNVSKYSDELSSVDNIVTIWSTTNRLVIKDTSCSTIDQLKAKVSGQYLYYETQNEVADIIDTIGVESGGTFTSNMFSWVENQQCADNFTDSSYWVRNRVTQTNTNNVATFVANSNAYDFVGFYRGANAGEFKKGHKYLISSKIRKTSGNGNAFRLEWQGISGTLQTISNPTLNTWYSFETIIEQTREDNQTTNAFVVSMRYASTSDIVVNSDSFECKEVEWVDLTLAFGSGNEPTSISDPRIQKILEMGYISTNTTGTLKSVDCEVLPNADTKIKGK